MPNERRTANGSFILEKNFFSFENAYYEFAHGMDYKDAMVFNYPPHIHDHYEIYVKLSGDISFMVNSVMYAIEDCDAVISCPGDVHNAIVHKDCTHDHYCLWFSSSALAEFFAEKNIRGVIRLSEEKKKQLKRLLVGLEDETNKLLITLDILRIITLLAEGEEVEELAMPEKLQNILKYIDENLVTVKDSQEIAENFSISVSTLNRLFTRNLHTTVHTLIEKKRLSYAKHLLDAGIRATDACFGAGFHDFSRFISKFKKEFGMTPAKYRGANQKQDCV